jgi:hypothetical protein
MSGEPTSVPGAGVKVRRSLQRILGNRDDMHRLTSSPS